MYRHSSLTFSPTLRRLISSGHSRETAFGIRAAVRFAHAVLELPHYIGEMYLPSEFGIVAQMFCTIELNFGQDVRTMLADANRVTTYVDYFPAPHPFDSNVRVAIAGHRTAATRAANTFVAQFNHRLGHITDLTWLAGQKVVVHYELETCYECHAQAHKPNKIEHRRGCPSDTHAGFNERVEYDRGSNASYHNKNRAIGGLSYDLGYDIGGVHYQADLACGRIDPSL